MDSRITGYIANFYNPYIGISGELSGSAEVLMDERVLRLFVRSVEVFMGKNIRYKCIVTLFLFCNGFRDATDCIFHIFVSKPSDKGREHIVIRIWTFKNLYDYETLKDLKAFSLDKNR